MHGLTLSPSSTLKKRQFFFLTKECFIAGLEWLWLSGWDFTLISIVPYSTNSTSDKDVCAWPKTLFSSVNVGANHKKRKNERKEYYLLRTRLVASVFDVPFRIPLRRFYHCNSVVAQKQLRWVLVPFNLLWCCFLAVLHHRLEFGGRPTLIEATLGSSSITDAALGSSDSTWCNTLAVSLHLLQACIRFEHRLTGGVWLRSAI